MFRNKSAYTQQEILTGIKNCDNQIAAYVFNRCFSWVRNYVTKNNGSVEDAFDVFQDAYLALYTKLTKMEVKLTCNFNTYFFAFCKNIWLKKLRNIKGYNQKLQELHESSSEYGDLYEEVNEIEEYLLYLEYYEQLMEICQKILEYFYNRINFEKIAELLDMLSAEQARKKKHRCIKQLKKSVRADVRYKELLES